MQRLLIAVLLMFSCNVPAVFAFQLQAYNQKNSTSNLSDIHFRDTSVKKRFGRSTLILGVAEVTPWTVDKYIVHADFANISFKTVAYNFSPKHWEWDDDGFTTNQLGHPTHGSIFFNAFRANGYSFWQSVPASFAGSYIWETAAEKQSFSPNDVINTGFGGVVLGEMLHHLSNKIINNRSRGFKRQASEVLGLIINPADGLNRIIDGRWGRIGPNSAEADSTKIHAAFDAGMRRFRVNNKDGHFGWYGSMRLMFGTPFENYKVPFGVISVNTEFGKDDSTILNTLNVYGSLNGWRVGLTDNSRHIALLTANYNYICNQAFSYSGQSVNLNLFSEFGLTSKLKINTVIGAGPIILAAVPHAYLYKSRYYDYCTGVGYNGSLMINLSNKYFYSINYRGGWVKTISGNASHYFLHAITSELRFKMIDNLSICAEPGYFTLVSDYKHHDDANKTYPYLRMSLRYDVSFL
ncbi:MAG: DUF3943 domain-containing protein [Mucilaginibacter sp.]